MSRTIRILGIAGSLRRQSYNRGILRAAAQLAPAEWNQTMKSKRIKTERFGPRELS